ncbi:DDE-type integrase/transposase/recombinase [Aerophototrophica crusticola]|uniref:DDE-type integrase/transposase/recombinase n=1 Tax=Aerophototrophica crusticola TaxID=1709002 RepID=A0A858R4V0_9PROT|nr:DDE-type integrase/transposase/recombinase [Rhodospirillaceae bacterium B3]
MTGGISYKPGSLVRWRSQIFRVGQAVTATSVLLEDPNGGDPHVVPVWELSAPEPKPSANPERRLLDALHPDDLAEAKRRFSIIKPLLAHQGPGIHERVCAAAEAHGTTYPTIYRWMKAYEGRRLLSDLAPRRRGKPMPKLLDPKVEAVISSVIKDFYLTDQKPNGQRTIEEVHRRCRAAKLPKPHASTIRARLDALEPQEKVLKRQGKKAAHDKFGAVKGEFPGADAPLAVVQIDHTLLDIIVVDEEQRLPIGRPWLTLAIDVFSRMVFGYHLSLDRPSAFAVGLCLCHGMLDKKAELERLGIKGEWPVWGKPRMVHADNGKDFRSHLIRDTLDEHDILYEFRPPKTPHYGGHIERLCGTLGGQIHALPGTTFSNPKKRGEYDSSGKACMTLAELRHWLLTLIVGIYHNKVHDGIKQPPLARWNDGVIGGGTVKRPTGLPDPIANPRRLRLDFLPFAERTVQPEGIVWDKIWYRDPLISQHVRSREGSRLRKFKVRRDPTDISKLYFLDPGLKDYVEIPYRDYGRPSISLWEYKAALNWLERQGKQAEDEAAIFAAFEDMHRIADGAKRETKRVRRQRAKRDEMRRHREDLTLDPPGITAAAPPAPVGPAPAPQAPRKGRGGKPHLSLVVDNPAKAPAAPSDSFDFPEDEISKGVEIW